MTFKTIKSNRRIIALLCVFVVFLSTISSSSSASRQVNCRKYVHYPECRGIAAKRDTIGRTNEDYRSLEDFTLSDADRSTLHDQLLNSQTLLGELLRKMVEKSIEHDSGTGNYLK